MEQDNIKENETRNKVEETEEVQTSSVKTNEGVAYIKEEKVEATDTENLTNGEVDNKNSAGKDILANVLDQLIIVACSSLLVFLCDSILRLFGYMFIKENGSLILAGGMIYFIINCIYVPIMEKTKLKNTIAKKILSI